jgi:hypothetical protein
MLNTASKKSSEEGETHLDGRWLRFGAASLLDCFPPNSKLSANS